MGQEVSIDPRPVRDAFDNIGQATVTDDDTFVDLLTMTLRTGYVPRLTLLGANVDPGAEAFATFRMLVNGNPVPNRLYSSFVSSPAVIYDPNARIIFPIDLPEGGYVQIQGKIRIDAAPSATTYGMYTRLRIEYVDNN